jgi:hypothetical protein
MQLVPVENHLRSGIGAAVNPWALGVVAVTALMFLMLEVEIRKAQKPIVGHDDLTPEQVEAAKADLARFEEGDRKIRKVWATGEVITLVFLVPVALAMPLAAGAILVLNAVAVYGVSLLGARRPDLIVRFPRPAMSVVFVVMLLSLGIEAYFRADPLPQALVKTEGKTYRGPLVAVENGAVYLARRGSGDALFKVVSVGKVVELRTRRQKREEERSVLNLVGIDWR